ncbi:ABC transporter ATP-binding protein [Dactylosporangium roseum]|uniref:ABC transporter ATP-binding protein n=1 Tax=Dactylosporangium roseum TaxID=47989 RepID=A0ABY5ZE19_9ACTN|nr:ABC transporter ATP-binding protein [Dactylosporangium roseum]
MSLLNRLHTGRPRTGVGTAQPPFVPPAGPQRYGAPRAAIGADRSHSWLRRALPIVLAHRPAFLASLLLSLVGLVVQVLIPWVLGHGALNAIMRDRSSITHYAIVLVVLAAVAAVAGYTSRRLLMTTAYAIEFDLRNLFYAHLSKMSFSYYDKVQSGQLISRANSDIRSVQAYLAYAPFILVQSSMAVLAFGLMLTVNVPLAFVAMLTVPFVYLAGARMRRVMLPVSWLIQARLAEVATIVDENVSGVRVVKAFAAEGGQLRLLARAAERLKWACVRDADLRARFTPLIQNLVQVGLVFILLLGGWLVIHDRLQVGDLLTFSLLVVMLQAPFQMLGQLIMMGQRASASAKRIYEVLDEHPTVVDRAGAVDLVSSRGEIRFESVSFAYDEGGPLVLDGFDLRLNPGDTVAVVGRAGAGKSTVGRLLTRFYDVGAGRVLVDGHDVRDLTVASLRSNIGLVLDEPFLFSASIRDNIAYGHPDADFGDVEAAARSAGAHEFIGALPDGYDTVVGERGYTLSGGQRQRIAIARALLVNPPILVLDDATSAIDVQVERQIHAGLRERLAGRTTLVIAHRLSTIGLADRVALLDRGRVIAEGTHQELMETVPFYQAVLAQVASDEEQQDRERAWERSRPDRQPGDAAARAGDSWFDGGTEPS